MTSEPATFLEIVVQLTKAVRHETSLARSGALAKLAPAAIAKQQAFSTFKHACALWHPDSPDSRIEQEALRDLLAATNESALVLEAVKGALDDFVARLRAAVSSLADAGTYNPVGRQARHVQAIRLDSTA